MCRAWARRERQATPAGPAGITLNGPSDYVFADTVPALERAVNTLGRWGLMSGRRLGGALVPAYFGALAHERPVHAVARIVDAVADFGRRTVLALDAQLDRLAVGPR